MSSLPPPTGPETAYMRAIADLERYRILVSDRSVLRAENRILQKLRNSSKHALDRLDENLLRMAIMSDQIEDLNQSIIFSLLLCIAQSTGASS